jgi:hypothetical protein
MPARRAGTAVTRSAKVVDGLLEALRSGMLGCAFRKPRTIGRNVKGRPMMPGAHRRVGIITKQSQALGLSWYAGPVEGWGKILAIASEALRDRRAVRKGT